MRRENIGVSFGYESVQAGTEVVEGGGGAGGNGASPPVICNSQVGRAERCEIPGRFSGEEHGERNGHAVACPAFLQTMYRCRA